VTAVFAFRIASWQFILLQTFRIASIRICASPVGRSLTALFLATFGNIAIVVVRL